MGGFLFVCLFCNYHMTNSLFERKISNNSFKIVIFFGLAAVACGILFLQSGIKLGPMAAKAQIFSF